MNFKINLIMNYKKTLYFLKENKIEIGILIIWLFLIWLNWISVRRLEIFFIIIVIICIFKLILNYLKISEKLKIDNLKILNLILILYKIKNPILLLLVEIECIIYDILIGSKNKFLYVMIFLLYLFLIN